MSVLPVNAGSSFLSWCAFRACLVRPLGIRWDGDVFPGRAARFGARPLFCSLEGGANCLLFVPEAAGGKGLRGFAVFLFVYGVYPGFC